VSLRPTPPYHKLNRRREDWATVAVCALVSRAADGTCRDVRIGRTNTGSRPMRASAAESALRGQPLDSRQIAQTADRAAEGTNPLSDHKASADYERHLARVPVPPRPGRGPQTHHHAGFEPSALPPVNRTVFQQGAPMTVATQQFAGTFLADPDHSSFQFAVKHMKVSIFRADFANAQARLVGEDSRLSLEGRARVESISIRNPPEFREHVVNGEDFFDAAKHPEIVFRSSRVELGQDGSASVEGELEIRGVSRPVTAAGTYQPPVDDPFGSVRTALELSATVDRREWDMGWQMPLPNGGDVLGYEVELTVHLELIKQG